MPETLLATIQKVYKALFAAAGAGAGSYATVVETSHGHVTIGDWVTVIGVAVGAGLFTYFAPKNRQ